MQHWGRIIRSKISSTIIGPRFVQKQNVWLCFLFPLFSFVSDGKSFFSNRKSCYSIKKLILTSKRHAEHLFAGRNTQQRGVVIPFCVRWLLRCNCKNIFNLSGSIILEEPYFSRLEWRPDFQGKNLTLVANGFLNFILNWEPTRNAITRFHQAHSSSKLLVETF